MKKNKKNRAKKELSEKRYRMPKKYEDKSEVPDTGTKFEKGSARQLAFSVVYNCVKKGQPVKEIRKEMVMVRKENGYKYNLDASYVNYVLATHPEYFKVYADGSVELLKEMKISPKSMKELRKKDVIEMRKMAKKVKEIRKKRASFTE